MKDDSESIDEFMAFDFVFQVESDHEYDYVPMTKGDFCMLNKKLDEILSQASTFINTKYDEILSFHHETIQKCVKEHDNKLSQDQKLVDDSTKLVEEASLQVLTLLTENEKEALYGLLFGLQKDNVDHHTLIANSILTLQTSQANENKIMDALAKATTKIQVLKEQLKTTALDLGKSNE
ncbi:unnamed protein product [Lactuca virosa]|uniref:Uncharacterized protein n=1 Tax=Lactuca virosa TaxID=75947 RepID=A0AAU9N7E0_9ASTR|nr:unnamed protein product [Lactuca virosa]